MRIGDVTLTGSSDVLRRFLQQNSSSFRLYLGYGGWGPEQLEQQLTARGWLSCDFHAHYVFDIEADLLWETVLADMGIDPRAVLPSDGEIV